jgi:hypothetical protein
MNKAKLLTGLEAVEFAERYNRLLTVRMPDGREYNAMPKQAHNLTLDTLSMDGSNILPSHISIEPFGEAIQCNRCQSWFLLNHLTIHGDSALCQSCFESSDVKWDLWAEAVSIGAVWWANMLSVRPIIVMQLLYAHNHYTSLEMTRFLGNDPDPLDRGKSLDFAVKITQLFKVRIETIGKAPKAIAIQNGMPAGKTVPMDDFTIELSEIQYIDHLGFRLPQQTVMQIQPNKIYIHFPGVRNTPHRNAIYYWEK